MAAFFQQGGQRAQIVRIVHDLDGVSGGSVAVPGRSRYDFGASLGAGGGVVSLTARNEGSWGDRLTVTLSFATSPVTCLGAEPSALVLEPLAEVTPGAWLRLVLPDGSRVLRSVVSVATRGAAGAAGFERVAQLDAGPGAGIRRAGRRRTRRRRRDPLRARSEHFEGLGLLPAHPNWIGQVLQNGSNLVELAGSADGIVPADVTLAPLTASLGAPGEDRYAAVSPDDFFGTLLEGDDAATDGLDVLLRVPEVASLVVPDLYSPAPVPVTEPVADPPTFAGATFGACIEVPGSLAVTPPPAGPGRAPPRPARRHRPGHHRHAAEPGGVLRRGAQGRRPARRAAGPDAAGDPAVAGALRLLLCGGLSSVAACAAASAGSPLVTVNPSAFAAGIIARTELVHGVPHGPANELMAGAVDVTDRVDPARHAVLHRGGVDVYRMRTDGVWLTGARTLSRDPSWRQLNVRRVVSLVERTVLSELAWTVFEPNDRLVRPASSCWSAGCCGSLFAQGAFAGATPAESYFVRTASDAVLPLESDAGQLVCQIGLAVTEPLEFILVSISRDAEGALSTETFGGCHCLATFATTFRFRVAAPRERRERRLRHARLGRLPGVHGTRGRDGRERVPRGRPEQRRGAAGRPGQVHQARPQAGDVRPRGRPGRLAAVAVAPGRGERRPAHPPLRRHVQVLGEAEAPVATWTFTRGLPPSWSGRSSTPRRATWRSRSCTSPTRDSGWVGHDAEEGHAGGDRHQPSPRPVPVKGTLITVQVNPTSLRLRAHQQHRCRQVRRPSQHHVPGLVVLDAQLRPDDGHGRPGRRKPASPSTCRP